MRKYKLQLIADFFQFYIEDDNGNRDGIAECWTQEAHDNFIAVTNSAIAIRTSRMMNVTVYIYLENTSPLIELSDFDLVNLASIKCDTGKLVISGCTEEIDDAMRISIEPRKYKATVGYKNLFDVKDEIEGNDSYHIWLYPEHKT